MRNYAIIWFVLVVTYFYIYKIVFISFSLVQIVFFFFVCLVFFLSYLVVFFTSKFVFHFFFNRCWTQYVSLVSKMLLSWNCKAGIHICSLCLYICLFISVNFINKFRCFEWSTDVHEAIHFDSWCFTKGDNWTKLNIFRVEVRVFSHTVFKIL